MKDKIYWTDAEWDKLTDIVWKYRKNDPGATIVALVKRALNQFPKDRQRPIAGNQQLKPLLERLTMMDTRMKHSETEVIRLTNKMAQIPTRQEVIDTITTDEILKHISVDDVLNLVPPERLLEQAMKPLKDIENIKRQIVTLQQQQHQIKDRRREEKPTKVCIVGLKKNQHHEVRSRFNGKAKLEFLDKDKKLPTGEHYDIGIISTKFTSHDTIDRLKALCDRIAYNNGGITDTVRQLEALIP